jgi:uncharacterized phage protein gp47/JayE
MALTIKDSAYHLAKIQASITGRIKGFAFFLWEPVSALAAGVAKRAAELSADTVQVYNDYWIDSAKGPKLDRRLGNEGVDRIPAYPASDGSVTLSRQTQPTTTNTFPTGSIQAATPPDPANPGAARVVYQNAQAVTIAPGATSWVVPFEATSGGANSNLPAGTALQLVTQASLLDQAVVSTAFTNGTDAESDDAYKLRGKKEIRSRTKGTDDALVAAALAAGAAFAYTVENTGVGQTPVTLYAADANGNLPAPLATNIARYLNGDATANPPITPARARGIAVAVQAASSTTFNFAIKLVLQAWVTADQTGDTLAQLQADIATALTGYVKSLNAPGLADRTYRPNAVKAIIRTFGPRGVLDVDDATFSPGGAPVALAVQQLAVMGTITWL